MITIDELEEKFTDYERRINRLKEIEDYLSIEASDFPSVQLFMR